MKHISMPCTDTVCNKALFNKKEQNFLSQREKLTFIVSEQALNFKQFLFLHEISIFIGFGVKSH